MLLESDVPVKRAQFYGWEVGVNTTLVKRFGADDVELERQRLGEDRLTTYNLVLTWLALEDTVRIEVEEIDSCDVCNRGYTITPHE